MDQENNEQNPPPNCTTCATTLQILFTLMKELRQLNEKLTSDAILLQGLNKDVIDLNAKLDEFLDGKKK